MHQNLGVCTFCSAQVTINFLLLNCKVNLGLVVDFVFRNKTKVDRLQGGDSGALEAKVTN